MGEQQAWQALAGLRYAEALSDGEGKKTVGTIVLKGKQAGAKEVYEAVEKEVGRIRVLYEIRPLLETRPLKKTGTEVFR